MSEDEDASADEKIIEEPVPEELEHEHDSCARKTAAINNYDNGIGLDPISEDSYHNEDSL